MGFESGRKRGMLWEDAEKLDRVIQEFPFNTTGKNEREFETGFATVLMANKSSFNSEIITQIDKSKDSPQRVLFWEKSSTRFNT